MTVSTDVSLIGLDISLVSPEVGAIARKILAVGADVGLVASDVALIVRRVTAVDIDISFRRGLGLDAHIVADVPTIQSYVLLIRSQVRSIPREVLGILLNIGRVTRGVALIVGKVTLVKTLLLRARAWRGVGGRVAAAIGGR